MKDNKSKDMPDAAAVCDMIVVPLIKKGPLNGEEYVTNFGYTCSTPLCSPGCGELVLKNIYRNLGWVYNCPRCNNYITFGDITSYINLISKTGKKIADVRTYMVTHMFYEGKLGTGDGSKHPLIRTSMDLMGVDPDDADDDE